MPSSVVIFTKITAAAWSALAPGAPTAPLPSTNFRAKGTRTGNTSTCRIRLMSVVPSCCDRPDGGVDEAGAAGAVVEPVEGVLEDVAGQGEVALGRVSCDVGAEQQVLGSENALFEARRFRVVDVEGRGEATVEDVVEQCLLVDRGTARGVDHDRAVGNPGDQLAGDHPLGRRHVRNVDRQESALYGFSELCRAHPERGRPLGAQVRVIDDDVAAERLEQRDQRPRRAARSDDPDLRPRQLVTAETGLLPPAAANRAVEAGEPPGEREHRGEAV